MLNRIDDREMLDSQRTMNPRWRHAYIKTKTPSERETEKKSERIEREKQEIIIITQMISGRGKQKNVRRGRGGGKEDMIHCAYFRQ